MQPGKTPDEAAATAATETADNELVDLYFSRDEAAVDVTKKKYGQYLHTVVRNILDNEADCDECLNDAYLSAWNHIPPDRPRSFLGYLTRIARNIALDRQKEKYRKKRAPEEGIDSFDELEDVIESGNTVESEVDFRLLSRYLSNFARSLPKDQRYIFLCRYYFFDSVQTIAGRLGVSTSAVYQKLAEIKKKLHKGLKKEGFL